MPESGDAQALVWLKQGDARGFDWAYACYAESIFGFLVRLARSRALAEDLFQHTFLRLAERGRSLRPDSDLRAWLFSVARNAFHSEVRARGVIARTDASLAPTPSASGPAPEAGLALADLERALASLEPEDRELLLLVGVEGLSYAQLTLVLDVDTVTVRKRVSRARGRLAQALDAGSGLLQTQPSIRGQ
ncbi:MAG: RNA polymerase sigma factor [Polyangiaceae bacterium]